MTCVMYAARTTMPHSCAGVNTRTRWQQNKAKQAVVAASHARQAQISVRTCVVPHRDVGPPRKKRRQTEKRLQDGQIKSDSILLFVTLNHETRVVDCIATKSCCSCSLP